MTWSVGVPLGIISAIKKESAFDNLDITDEERSVFELIARQASTADEICSMLNIDFSESQSCAYIVSGTKIVKVEL